MNTELISNFSDDDWNDERERLETVVLRAAAELLAYTQAGAIQIAGYGATLKIEATQLNG